MPDQPSSLSCCLSATGVRFLGILFPPRNSAPLTVGLPRSSAWTRTGFPCSARMRHGWDRAPSLPRGRRCSHGQSGILDRRLPPLNGRSLSPRSLSPSRDVGITGHQQGFKIVRPPSLPFACDPRTERGPSGFSLSSTPDWAGPGHACQGRDRPRTLTRITSSTSSNLLQRNHSPRATSCRNPVCRRPTQRGAGQPQGVQVERPTGRTTLAAWGLVCSALPGSMVGGMAAPSIPEPECPCRRQM